MNFTYFNDIKLFPKNLFFWSIILVNLTIIFSYFLFPDNATNVLLIHFIVLLFTTSGLLFTGKLIHEKNDILAREKELTKELKNNKIKLESTITSERNQRILAVSLREMTLSLTSKMNEESLLGEILYQSAFMVRHKAASIILFENNNINVVRVKGYKTSIEKLKVKNSSFYRNILKLKKKLEISIDPVIINDVSADNLWRPIKNEDWIKSHLSAPIKSSENLIGILRLESDKVDNFNEVEIKRILPFTSATAIALENTRLLRDSKLQNEHLDSLHQISKELMALSELDELLKQIVNRAIKLLNGEAGGIYLYREESDDLEWKVAIGKNVAKTGTILKRGEGISGTILNTKKPKIIHNYQNWKGIKSSDWANNPISILAVPIKKGNEFFGVLNIRFVDKKDFKFCEKDKELAYQFATLAAIAIENSKLYEKSVREITERKKTEQLLHESEKKYRRLIDQSNDAIYLLYNNKFEIINQQFTNMFGYNSKEVRKPKFNFMQLVAPESHALIKDRIKKTKAGKHVEPIYEFQAINKSGKEIECEVSVSYVQYGKGEAIQGIIRDISARKQVETQLARLASLVDQSSEAIVITDLKGNIEYVNPACVKTSGYSKEELLGKNPRLFKSGKHESEFYYELWHTIRNGNPWSGILINKKKDGNAVFEDSIIFPIKDKNKKIINYAAVKKNITGERKLEEQLFQSQKLEAIGQLAGGIAHDFNNILTVINGYSDLALLKSDETNPLHKGLLGISNAGKKASDLVRQLLAFSRKQIIEPQKVNINKLVEDLDKMMNRLIGEDVKIIRNLENNLPGIKADPAQIEQILINLVVNARDAINSNSGKTAERKITIDTNKITLDKNFSTDKNAKFSGRFISLSISDTGSGMDEETKGKIFEPFFTTKAKGEGTGLGLSTVYGIVKQNNGMIFVYSEVGLGTTFRIYWPSIETFEEKKQLNTAVGSLIGGNEKILVVEDDIQVQNFISESLVSLGYKVSRASNGVEGLRIFNQRDHKIDLVVTDVVMPDMGGSELAQILTKKKPGLKIIFTSGYTDKHVIRKGIIDQEINFLPKPYSIDVLAKKIREVLEVN